MPLPIPDRERALAMLNGSTRRFTAQLRTADGKRNAIGKWSTAELATHVGQIYSMYVDFLGGGTSPVTDHRNISPTWERMVAEDPERDLFALAERIEKSHEAFQHALSDVGWTEEVGWQGSLRVPVYALAGILVNEAEIHGRDVSIAESSDWKIPRPNAVLALESLYTVMPEYLKADAPQDLDATWCISVRGGSSTYFHLAGGRMEITTEPPGRVDCRISADPVSYLLIGYGRIGQWKPLFTGKIVAYGRKPWLGLTFAKLFQSV